MNRNDDVKLSERGISRREEMIGELKTSLRIHQQQKQLRRTVFGAAVCLLVVGVCVMQWRNFRDPDRIAAKNEKSVATTQSKKNEFESQEPSSPIDAPLLQFEKVSDEEILALLKETGQPSILAEVDHQIVVIPIRKSAAKSELFD